MLCGSMVKHALAEIAWHLGDILGAILLVKATLNGKNN